jgi:hypothetical protein
MGRTNPSFRLAIVMEEKEWKSFRDSLVKSERKIFDDMFSISHLYNSACSYSAKYVRIHPIFMSIIFHHYKQLTKLTEQVEKNV